IGTQITEAFAGLDRIREIRRLATEDAEDGSRAPLAEVEGDVVFENVSFEYVAGTEVLKRGPCHAPAGATTALGGSAGARGRQRFVIAARLSASRGADEVLVLEGGQIVERGTHPELLAKHGRYRQLYDKQYRFEQDVFVNPGEDFTPEPDTPVATPPLTPPTRL